LCSAPTYDRQTDGQTDRWNLCSKTKHYALKYIGCQNYYMHEYTAKLKVATRHLDKRTSENEVFIESEME